MRAETPPPPALFDLLEPKSFSHRADTSFFASTNPWVHRRVRRAFSRFTFRKRSGQELVHLFALDQVELPKHRHADESAGHFFDRQKLIDELQHASVVAFGGIDLGKRVP